MRLFAWSVAVLVLSLITSPGAFSQMKLPENPHQFMNRTDSCPDCHNYYEGVLEPHYFILPMADECHKCHSKEKLGRSHPVGVDPYRSDYDITVPDELPLEEDMVSCGSCHNPHAEWLSTTRSFFSQTPQVILKKGEEEILYYKTFYLRISDPEEGFAPLCQSCHRDY